MLSLKKVKIIYMHGQKDKFLKNNKQIKLLPNNLSNRQIIEEGVNEQKILKKFLNRNWDRMAIQEDIFKRFNSQKIISQYESLFIDITK